MKVGDEFMVVEIGKNRDYCDSEKVGDIATITQVLNDGDNFRARIKFSEWQYGTNNLTAEWGSNSFLVKLTPLSPALKILLGQS